MTATEIDAAAMAERVTEGKPAAVARAITWIENGDPRGSELLSLLPSKRAHVIGVTGSPGAGKSTLVSLLVRAFRERGSNVGVLAVDPSSPITGGALLGDRVRLEGTTGDRGVFFRSLASRGASGGLSAATRAATQVLSAGGFDVVLVETVGAGQAEVSVMRVADTVALVLIPGSGDEVQAHKAGLMEIADIYVLNKADLPGTRSLKSQVEGVLHLGAEPDWLPPVVEAVATEGRGVDEILEAIDRHGVHLEGGTRVARERRGAQADVLRSARASFDEAVASVCDDVFADMEAGRLSESAATEALVRGAASVILEGSPAEPHRPRA
jgi:LAO/AO transport system kinase